MTSGAATADATFMARAIALAERARHLARPNPHVGCVLVRDGSIIGEGRTEPPGQAHAEVAALAAAGDASGATAYVTLEPCAHTGRTGPCAQALRDARVARVVFAVTDPNATAAGGTQVLQEAGIEVTGGVLHEWVGLQLAGFLTTATRGRPHVVLKLAQTVDGALTAPDGRWVTGPAARRVVHAMRARADAVLVGAGTVLADDPRLDVRDAPLVGPQPRAVVLDGRGRTPETAAVVRPGTIVVTSVGTASWADRLAARGATILRVPPGPAGGVDLDATMRRLWRDEEVAAVFAEPGATLAQALMDADLVDRSVRHVATSVRTTDGVPRIVAPMAATATWPLVRRRHHGPDLEVVARRPD